MGILQIRGVLGPANQKGKSLRRGSVAQADHKIDQPSHVIRAVRQ